MFVRLLWFNVLCQHLGYIGRDVLCKVGSEPLLGFVSEVLSSQRGLNPRSCAQKFYCTIYFSNIYFLDTLQVFGTLANLQNLCNSSTALLDVTFKCVPSLFEQLYTIHRKYISTFILFAC